MQTDEVAESNNFCIIYIKLPSKHFFPDWLTRQENFLNFREQRQFI